MFPVIVLYVSFYYFWIYTHALPFSTWIGLTNIIKKNQWWITFVSSFTPLLFYLFHSIPYSTIHWPLFAISMVDGPLNTFIRTIASPTLGSCIQMLVIHWAHLLKLHQWLFGPPLYRLLLNHTPSFWVVLSSHLLMWSTKFKPVGYCNFILMGILYDLSSKLNLELSYYKAVWGARIPMTILMWQNKLKKISVIANISKIQLKYGFSFYSLDPNFAC